MTDLERYLHKRCRYLLTRCLRLERKIIALERERALGWRSARIGRHVQPSDITLMQELRARGMQPSAIARRLGWSSSTVLTHTRVVPMEREATNG